MILPCPREGCEAEIEVVWLDDWQGDGAWATLISYTEIEEQTCSCEYTDAELQQIDEMAMDCEASRHVD